MSLFDSTPFIGASGAELNWKIECDVLQAKDWECLAWMAASFLPTFSAVWGVPTGGIPFADALREHAVPGVETWLVADDVWTTGGSVNKFRTELVDGVISRMASCLVVVGFNRSSKPMPNKAHAVFSVHPDVLP